ncbi:uncharacterized protein LOC126975229 [Leptidea sinapis]|uniref:uncharacterized protein LOC126975229 n=1 Tax=Leptidea sinapis TaxID=189913 RepID=UPI0021215FE4|nr:uncharacterized protein LOC126975229 [Leptidea sinapis]
MNSIIAKMYPVKEDNIFYDNLVNNIQRLFIDTEKNDSQQFSVSPSNYSIANRSSSSNETSPESYFDYSFYQSDSSSLRNQAETNNYQQFRSQPRDITGLTYSHGPNMLNTQRRIETPIRRERPILGRQVLPETGCLKEPDNNMWPSSPEKQGYELFPIKKESPLGSLSPISNRTSSFSISPTYVDPPQATASWRLLSEDYYNMRPASTSTKYEESKMCTLCKKNGERPQVYMDHNLKEKKDKRYVVTCPILRSHVCTICSASGDNAHTLSYCPVLRNKNNGKPLPSTTITLKSTRVKSNGQKRY